MKFVRYKHSSLFWSNKSDEKKLFLGHCHLPKIRMIPDPVKHTPVANIINFLQL